MPDPPPEPQVGGEKATGSQNLAALTLAKGDLSPSIRWPTGLRFLGQSRAAVTHTSNQQTQHVDICHPW